MSLDELIAQMTNPQDFTRLCNSVFTEIYGDGFQVIDGTRGDDGNDGYVASERRILAIYCPLKPEQRTDADFLKKIRSDLKKAGELKAEGRLAIEVWTFITPRKLSNGVIIEMRQIAESYGMRASHQESTFLANQLYLHPHLKQGFPSLHAIDLAAKIDALTESIERRHAAPSQPEELGPAATPRVARKSSIRDEAGEARVHALMAGTPTEEGKAELKAIACRTTDHEVEMNAILSLFRWFDPSDDDRGELQAFATRGIDRARSSGSSDAEALFHAHLASVIGWDFMSGYMEAHFTSMVDIAIPFAVAAVEQRQQRLARLRGLDEQWKAEVASALDLIRSSRDPELVGGVLLTIGTLMGQLALTFKNTGNAVAADSFIQQCRGLLMHAKDAYVIAGDELGAANAAFGVANQVRFHGGVSEAIHLARWTVPLAEKHGDRLLAQKAKWLLHTLETGEIPDYVAGERRKWAEEPPSPRPAW